MQISTDTLPSSDVDLFSDASLRDPYSDFRQLRDLGPVVKLARPDVYALGRFSDVRDALQTSNILISGDGVGFGAAWNSRPNSSVLQSDGDLHRRLRSAVLEPLRPEQLEKIRGQLKAMIQERVASLCGRGEFDAMIEIARLLPVEAIAHFVGLPRDGRERMLEWAAATFNTIGPDSDPDDLLTLQEVRGYVASLNQTTVKAGSWAGQLFERMQEGKLSEGEALSAINAYVIPSLDTTIFAKGHLLYNLAKDPGQWALLRERPELVPSAVLESVRHSSVVRWFSRTATEDYLVGEHRVPAGARVMLMYGSANRDERHYADPDKFDITRNPRDQLAWGRGRHLCAGMHLARLEMEVMLEALIECGEEIHTGEPVVGVNQGLFGFVSLPFRIG